MSSTADETRERVLAILRIYAAARGPNAPVDDTLMRLVASEMSLDDVRAELGLQLDSAASGTCRAVAGVRRCWHYVRFRGTAEGSEHTASVENVEIDPKQTWMICSPKVPLNPFRDIPLTCYDTCYWGVDHVHCKTDRRISKGRERF
jgi:hypothetical protein